MPRSRRRRALPLLAVALIAPACGDDGGDAGDERADQVRAAALEAGLPDDVADVLALAARGATATFQVTYPGEDGAEVVVSQAPPDRRVDLTTAGLIVQSQVVSDGVAYQCDLAEGGAPGDPLECRRTQAAGRTDGAFTPQALDDFTEDLAARDESTELRVEERTIAGVTARCLVATAGGGPAPEGAAPATETICLAPEGAQLLLEAGDQRVEAVAYTTTVPEGTFEV